MDCPGTFIREARQRHGLSQAALARRARTTQKQVRPNRDAARSRRRSPTVARLLAAMGKRLELRAVPGAHDNRSDAELHADFRELSATERIVSDVGSEPHADRDRIEARASRR